MPLGSLEDGRGGFVQDATGGIALLLPADPAEPIVAGALVRASGTVDDRYAQRTIRLDGPPVMVGSAALPEAIPVGTGAASEALEGTARGGRGGGYRDADVPVDGSLGADRRRIGRVARDPRVPRRVRPGAGRDAAGDRAPWPARHLWHRDRRLPGSRDGPGGDHGRPGTDAHAPTPPEPTPTPDPTPTPRRRRRRRPHRPRPPTPTPTPTPSTSRSTIAAARALGSDARVTVEGIVSAEAGRIGLPPQIAIQDATGGLVVKLPDGAPRPGARRRGPGDREARRSVRPARASAGHRRRRGRSTGSEALPDPLPGSAASLGEATEARLVVLEGTLEAPPARETSGDLVLRLVDDAGMAFRARATRAAGIEPTARADRRPAAAHGHRGPARLAQGRARRVPALAPRRGRPGRRCRTPPRARPRALPRRPRRRPPDAAVRPIAAVLRLAEGSVRVDGGRDDPGHAPRRLGPPPDRPGCLGERSSSCCRSARRPRAREPACRSTARSAPPTGRPASGPRPCASSGVAAVPAPRRASARAGIRATRASSSGSRAASSTCSASATAGGRRCGRSGGTIVVAGLAGAGIPAADDGRGRRGRRGRRRPSPASRRDGSPLRRGAPRGRRRPRDAGADGGRRTRRGRQPAARPVPTPPAGRPGTGLGSRRCSPTGPSTPTWRPCPDRAGVRVRVGGIVVAVDGDRVLVDDGTATGEPSAHRRCRGSPAAPRARRRRQRRWARRGGQRRCHRAGGRSGGPRSARRPRRGAAARPGRRRSGPRRSRARAAPAAAQSAPA